MSATMQGSAVGNLPPLDEDLYRRRRRARGLHEDVTSFWFLLPILAVFVVLFLVPLAQTAYFSFTDFNGYSMDMSWVGLDNYKKVFTDPSTLQGLGFTILYAIVVMVGVTVIAIPLAVTSTASSSAVISCALCSSSRCRRWPSWAWCGSTSSPR